LAFSAPAHAVNAGTNVTLGTYPNFATLLYTTSSGSFICGGWLADARHVVTAAHCVKDTKTWTTNNPSQFYVYLNKLPGVSPFRPEPSYQAQALFAHPSHDASDYGNDLAVVRLAAPVSGITPWSYAKSPATLSATPECALYTVIGHGQTCDGGCLSIDLQRTTVPKLVGDSCVRTEADYDYTEWTASIVGPDACFGFAPPCGSVSARNPNSCAGDSGGPIFDAANTVVGLVSRGSTKACTQAVKPGIYTAIGNADNAEWLASVLASANAPPPPPPLQPPKPPGVAPLSPGVVVVASSARKLRVARALAVLIWGLFGV
jgi:secreted trypsin-like serine protease